MNRCLAMGCACWIYGALVCSPGTAGNGQAAGRDTQSANTQSTPNCTVVLLKPLDARTAKPGDELTARTTREGNDGQTAMFPSGTELTGRIVEVTVRTDDQPTSQIVLSFERALEKTGKSIAIAASIVSLIRPETVRPENAAGHEKSKADGETEGQGNFAIQQHHGGTAISSNSEDVLLESGTKLVMQVKRRE